MKETAFAHRKIEWNYISRMEPNRCYKFMFVSLAWKYYGRNVNVNLLVQFVWRAGFYLRHVSKTIDSMRHSKIAPALCLFFFFFLYLQRTRVSFKIAERILARGSVVRSRNSNSHSLGTFLHPRPPRHSRLSDVRNRERLKHKGFSERHTGQFRS